MKFTTLNSWLIRFGILVGWCAFFWGMLWLNNFLLVRSRVRELSICTWGDVFDPALIDIFEKETGIKVNLSYYTSNEELLLMLKTTRGTSCDLVVPSDYAVDVLRKRGLLKKLDWSHLPAKERFNTYLLDHYFDPHNEYSVPFIWEIHGLGIDKDVVSTETVPSWGMLFDASHDVRRVMTNDPLDAFSIAAQYLFGTITYDLTCDQVARIQELLTNQRKNIEAYSSLRSDYFLVTKNFSVVVAPSSFILRSMQQYSFVDFVVPREGGFMVIENLALLASSKKDDLAYIFINFLFRKEILKEHFKKFFYFPPTTDVLSRSDLNEKMYELITSSETFKRLAFFRHVIPENYLYTLWVQVKTP
jgi:spermidine/putrescine transport system substrate-binding protein